VTAGTAHFLLSRASERRAHGRRGGYYPPTAKKGMTSLNDIISQLKFELGKKNMTAPACFSFAEDRALAGP
jgi:hypothetical protein